MTGDRTIRYLKKKLTCLYPWTHPEGCTCFVSEPEPGERERVADAVANFVSGFIATEANLRRADHAYVVPVEVMTRFAALLAALRTPTEEPET